MNRILSVVLAFALMSVMVVFPTNAATTDQAVSGAYYNQNKYSSQTYSGNDLGATYTPGSTTWKVWSPEASSVVLKIYKTGSDSESGAGVVGTYNLSKSSEIGRAHV